MQSSTLQDLYRPRRPKSKRSRQGAVTVETAIILPLLIYLFLGAVDIGQYVDLSQTVTNASRDGARLAARDSTTTVTQVKQNVYDYLSDRFPDKLTDSLADTVNIELLDDQGQQIAGNDLTVIQSGSQFSVKVTFDYSAVRWIKALGNFLQEDYVVTTVGRRE